MSRVTVVIIHDVKSLVEKHTDGIPAQFFMLFDFDISACYNFIFKGLIKQVILYSQMCIGKFNITVLIFFKGSECWDGA